jgi:hypothetical protein
MKKCGAKPILDTYVQLAYGLATLQRQRPETLKSRQIVDIIDKLETVDECSQHKGIGILMTVLKNTALQAQDPTPIVTAAKKLWAKSNPFDHETAMPDNEIEMYLTHYLLIMDISSTPQDWKDAALLLPHLLKHKSSESRIAALRIARRLHNEKMAIQYWNSFALPFDKRAGSLYLRILSRGKSSDIVYGLLLKFPEEERKASVYMLALLPCLHEPNLDIALRIYDLVKTSPMAQYDVPIHDLMMKILLRATERMERRERHSPEKVYGVLRKMNLPGLLKLKDVPADTRLALIASAKRLVLWRHDQKMTTKDRGLIEGDAAFFKRWEKIIKNQVSGGKMQTNSDESVKESIDKDDRREFVQEQYMPVERQRERSKSGERYSRQRLERTSNDRVATRWQRPVESERSPRYENRDTTSSDLRTRTTSRPTNRDSTLHRKYNDRRRYTTSARRLSSIHIDEIKISSHTTDLSHRDHFSPTTMPPSKILPE